MGKKAICILCNNLDYLQAFVNNYNQKDEDLIIVNETRVGNKIEGIRRITKDNNVIILDSKEIVLQFKKTVSDNVFVDEYTMGMNILAQWYVFRNYDYEKVLFLDDDVLINDKIDELFEFDKSLFYKFRLSAGGKVYNENGPKYKLLIKAFGDIFDLDINEENYQEVWIGNHLANGQRMYTKNDYDFQYYEQTLKKFYENEILRALWNNRTLHTSYHLDEWFETMFAYKTGIINDELKTRTYIEMSDDKRVDFKKYNKINKCAIWHNATCSHKLNWLMKLKINKLIK